MYVIKKGLKHGTNETTYDIGAIVNGVWFSDGLIDNHDDARQMVNYLNGGDKMPDTLKARYCFIVIQDDFPPRIIGPMKTRETRDSIARGAMREIKHAKFYAVTWKRDYLPEIRVLSRDELRIRERTYLAQCYCIEGDSEYSDQFLFTCKPDDADKEYIKALEARYKAYTPDLRQDDTWVNASNGCTVEANGYKQIPTTHEMVLKGYIK